MRRLLRIDGEADAHVVTTLTGRFVPSPNLRGWAAVLPRLGEHDEHLLRAGLERTRLLILSGPGGLALVGDAFALFHAGVELAALSAPAVAAVGAWLRDASSFADGNAPALSLGTKTFDWSTPVVMGVLNVTPDSFSDGGRFVGLDAAVRHAEQLVADGAAILDVGGESTRPRGATYGAGAATISVDEELSRVVPVISALRGRVDAAISVDTRKSAVAAACIEGGATLINDVTGLLHDPGVAAVAARTGAALCLMHTPADIEQLQHEHDSDDILGDVLAGLEVARSKALAAGVPGSRLLLDPGLGFGKRAGQNLFLVRHLASIAALGQPVLVGASRKATFARAGSADGSPIPVDQRLAVSVAAAVLAADRGAHVIRAHDVRETMEALRVARAIRTSADGGARFR